MKLGSYYLENGKCRFVVWAPIPEKVELKIVSPVEKIIPMEKFWRNYWQVELDDIEPDTKYFYNLDGTARPDPASNFQPEGVHGPSQVIAHNNFKWQDEEWNDIEISKLIIYELHVGTFTEEGTYKGIISKLNDLKELGITAIQIMPIAQFPGERNWGYDGVYMFAPQNSYGRPEDLKELVNECHKMGIAVILDVVYNHFGPEGNYTCNYGHYFTDKHHSPWGDAVNYDDTHSTEVRNYFIENTIHWFRDYHIDGLRLDAVHAMFDISAKHILQELAEKVDEYSKQQGRKYYMIAESDLNDTKITKSIELGGYGLDAQWSDDFTHSLRTLLTGENQAYYMDFGKVEHLTKAFKEGFVCAEMYSKYRQRNHGNSSKLMSANKFVVFLQNHDQIGNRMLGERLTDLMDYESFKLGAGTVLLSPFIPFLFMGEEYAEDNPFLYFVHHSDENLIKGVREGRKNDFKAFKWHGEPPDPQDVETFNKSKLSWNKKHEGKHKTMFELYKELIRIRKEIPAIYKLDKDRMIARSFECLKVMSIQRWGEEEDNSHILAIFNFNQEDVELDLKYFIENNDWVKLLDSSEQKWYGNGTFLPEILNTEEKVTMRRRSFALYKRGN